MLDALVVVVVEVAASIAITGVILPAPSSIPLLAVTTPIESTKVTSSYVMVPATDILPPNSALPLTVKSPLKCCYHLKLCLQYLPILSL